MGGRIAMPDKKITVKMMHNYGYTWDGMLPLGFEAAKYLFQRECSIYRLYPDNTEGGIWDMQDLLSDTDCLFGIELDDWIKIKDDPTLRVPQSKE